PHSPFSRNTPRLPASHYVCVPSTSWNSRRNTGTARNAGRGVNRQSLLFPEIGELLLSNLSETVVVVGNAPHDRPGFLVCHLIGNRASFLCTKAPMIRIPETNFLHHIN